MRVALPQELDSEWVDSHAEEWLSQEGPLEVDASRIVSTRMFGEGRLLGVLAAIRDTGREIELQVGELPLINVDPRHHRWRFFREEPTGIVLAAVSTSIKSSGSAHDRRSEVIDLQNSALAAAGGEVWTGHSHALVAVDEFRSFKPLPVFVSKYRVREDGRVVDAKTGGLSFRIRDDGRVVEPQTGRVVFRLRD